MKHKLAWVFAGLILLCFGMLIFVFIQSENARNKIRAELDLLTKKITHVDLTPFIQLPTEVELATYTESQRTQLKQNITNVLEVVGAEYDTCSNQRSVVMSEIKQLGRDWTEKRIKTQDYSKRIRKLLIQHAFLQQRCEYALAVKEALRTHRLKYEK